MNTLIIGGTSGLGLELGRRFRLMGHAVYATGRSKKTLPVGIHPLVFTVTDVSTLLSKDVEVLVGDLPKIDVLIYTAGFYKPGRVAELSDEHIVATVNAGLLAPAFLLKGLIRKQGELNGFIAISSTSQLRPREQEPLYAATKAGLGMLAQSVSLDPAIKKTLVVAPSGMDTPFWLGSGRKVQGLLSPAWVADRILELWREPYACRTALILREPERVEILETR